MKFAVKILPKTEVLDTQGRAVQSTLQNHGFELTDCHVGRYIVLEMNTEDADLAMSQAQKMVEKGLFNPLIETYQLEQL